MRLGLLGRISGCDSKKHSKSFKIDGSRKKPGLAQ